MAEDTGNRVGCSNGIGHIVAAAVTVVSRKGDCGSSGKQGSIIREQLRLR